MVLGIPKKTLMLVAILAGIVVLYVMGSDRQASEAESGSGPAGCRVAVTADVLNVRAAPGMDAEIVGKYKQDAETDADAVVRNGFRRLAENRWAADEFLKPVGGSTREC
ncbi:SH3 domain-containing protein [Qaidamihabitans albus]|uniref:SH3 domain-containing protein n=1 Tax=Qaidamihabitans albus TaxID=2795733 RepID=UPI0018F24210|nr:SH3 domain-containing protein [Qaidamihabitans albus]